MNCWQIGNNNCTNSKPLVLLDTSSHAGKTNITQYIIHNTHSKTIIFTSYKLLLSLLCAESVVIDFIILLYHIIIIYTIEERSKCVVLREGRYNINNRISVAGWQSGGIKNKLYRIIITSTAGVAFRRREVGNNIIII